MRTAQKWYTRIIGIFFILIFINIVTSLMNVGFGPETMHKIFHVGIGAVVLSLGWSNKKFWRPFCLVNGAFFAYLALTAWIFPNLLGLKAFGFSDTILHTIVGVSGLIIGLPRK